MDVSLQSRRSFLKRTALLAGAALTARAAASQPSSPVAALQKARRFLLAHQDADGAWRSARYPAFRQGDSLTPLVLWALGNGEQEGTGVNRGLAWLEKLSATQ